MKKNIVQTRRLGGASKTVERLKSSPPVVKYGYIYKIIHRRKSVRVLS